MGLSEQEALTELLRLCALQPQHLLDHDFDKLRVTKGGVLPKNVVGLVSPSSMIQSPAEFVGSAVPGSHAA